jgi:RNA polymerase sigma factor (sigma-70 family)
MEQHMAYSTVGILAGRSAFDTLFLRLRPLAYAVAVRITQDSNEAEDVVQAAFCKMWARNATLHNTNIKGWLTLVTQNIAIDHVRRRRRERAYFESEKARPVAAISAEVEALQNIEYSHLVRALERLGSDSRTLLIESFFAGRSHSVIALSRAMALGTVKTRIRTGLKHLRQFIA